VRFISPYPAKLPDVEQGGLVAAVDGYVTMLRAFYHSRAIWHRRFYRVSGALVILTGAGLPVLANLDYGAKNVVVSLAGTLVAVLAALHGFYRWDQSWILLRNTEITITASYWEWRAALAETDDVAARTSLTSEFLRTLAKIRDEESLTYFKNLAFPATTGSQLDSR
jgi:hypothetical protein